MTTTRLAKRPLPPTRLVVIQAEGIAVYEGRKCVAYTREDLEFTAEEIEVFRSDDYSKRPENATQE